MRPSLFTLGRLIILRVASLREERPEPLRRVRRGDWPCVISDLALPPSSSSSAAAAAKLDRARQFPAPHLPPAVEIVMTLFVNSLKFLTSTDFRGSEIQSPVGRFFCEGGSSLVVTTLP